MKTNDFSNKMNQNNINEEEKPNGLKAVEKAHKETKKDSDAFHKDDTKRVDALNKGAEGGIKPKKFNYTDDQKEYHDEMEILNGQEMIQYTEEPDDAFKERNEKAITGDSTMGNEVKLGEWNPETGEGSGNTEPVWGASDAKFGEKLVKRAKDSLKKRNDAEVPFKALGDDIEASKKKKAEDMKKLSFESVLGSDAVNHTHYAVLKNTNKIVEGWDYSGVSNFDLKQNPGVYFSHYLDNKLGEGYKKSDVIIVSSKGLNERNIDPTIKENWMVAITETATEKPSNKMKRLIFKKPFNGLENAIKLIPESYKVDGKAFQMTDGNETYNFKWEGTLKEGVSIVLGTENKALISEDMAKIKRLMNYDSKEAIGAPSKTDRLQENYILDLNIKRLKESVDEVEDEAEETEPKVEKYGMEEAVVESTGKFKAQRLDFGDYGKFVSFKKANYLKEGEEKKITGVEYHIVLENTSLPKETLVKVITEGNKNKKPDGKEIKFSFYDTNDSKLDNLTKSFK